MIDTIAHTSHVGSVFAAFTASVPLAVFLAVLGLLNARVDQRALTNLALVLAIAVLVLLTLLTAGIVTLPVSILVMAGLVAALRASHVAGLSRARQPADT